MGGWHSTELLFDTEMLRSAVTRAELLSPSVVSRELKNCRWPGERILKIVLDQLLCSSDRFVHYEETNTITTGLD